MNPVIVEKPPPADSLTLPDLPSICIAFPGQDRYSETFIRAHIERLPTRVHTLYGGYYPRYYDGDNLLLPSPTRYKRWSRKLLSPIPGYITRKNMPIKTFLLQHRIKAVMAEYGPTGVRVMEECNAANVPLIVHFHGYDAYTKQTLKEYGAYYPALFKRAAALIAVSQEMKRHLIKMGAPPDKVHYNPCCADTTLFQPSTPAQSPPTFVSVGRFVDKKGPHLTLLAFAQVVKQVPEARLVMVGDGPLWESSRQLAEALDIAQAINLPGALPHKQVATMLAGARALVQHSLQTSYGDSEGTPVAISEAGATGLPVVATRHAGIQDVVLDGETGLLVDEGDVSGMAAAMVRLAQDPRLAGKIGQAARKRIMTKFTMDKSIDNLWQIIKTVIAENEVVHGSTSR